MTDAAFIPLISDGHSLPGFDIAMSGPDLLAESGLQTAIIMSLFTDRRALPDDVIPDGGTDRRGWWGEAEFGSRLWLLEREKQMPSVLIRAREYSEEALQWLIDDGVAASITVTTEWVKAGMLGLRIEIQRPDNTSETHRFQTAWEATTHAI